GWAEEVRESWPWDLNEQPNGGVVVVRFARRKVVKGHDVTVVEALWTADALGGAATTYHGRGSIVIVKLPIAYPAAAIQRRRRPNRKQRDAFDRRFRIIVEDATFATPLRSRSLRDATVGRRIPTWSICGDEIYAVVSERRVFPADRFGLRTPPRVRPLSA